jgi:hypothetical protein
MLERRAASLEARALRLRELADKELRGLPLCPRSLRLRLSQSTTKARSSVGWAGSYITTHQVASV